MISNKNLFYQITGSTIQPFFFSFLFLGPAKRTNRKSESCLTIFSIKKKTNMNIQTLILLKPILTQDMMSGFFLLLFGEKNKNCG